VALDPKHIGRAYPPNVYRVGREKIREFATAIGATQPEYFDPEAAAALGYPDVVAPPTFPIVLVSGNQPLIEDRELDLDYGRVVHGDQRFALTRPVHAGDVLTAVMSIAEITVRAGHDFLTYRVDVTDETGEQVVTAWSKIVIRGHE
jgi:acyl dehydratase